MNRAGVNRLIFSSSCASSGSPTTFPSGMPAVSKAVHAAGCKFGIYSAASQRTCGNWSASEFNEVKDAQTFALEWEIGEPPAQLRSERSTRR